MQRHGVLQALHRSLKPRTYLEIGVNLGLSLTLSRSRSIGIDPAFAVTSELLCDVHLVRSTSDEFFARPEPLAHFDEPVIDLGFIDGMHLAEYAYRDFVNVERYCSPTSVVMFDDMLPRSIAEAARDRFTTAWAGDVYKVTDVLRRLRPDLTVIELDTTPTGTALVLGCDPSSTVLADRYHEVLGELSRPDPQDPPASVLNRTTAADPAEVMASDVWPTLRSLRGRRAGVSEVRAAIAESDLPTGAFAAAR